jgi:hypothetical protein
MKQVLLSISIGLLLVACKAKPSPPADMLDRETFVNLLVEVQLIEAIYNQNMIRNDNPRERLARYYRDTFLQFDVSRDDFTRTYAWYYKHPLLLMEVYQDVIEELTRRQTELMQAHG